MSSDIIVPISVSSPNSISTNPSNDKKKYKNIYLTIIFTIILIVVIILAFRVFKNKPKIITDNTNTDTNTETPIPSEIQQTQSPIQSQIPPIQTQPQLQIPTQTQQPRRQSLVSQLNFCGADNIVALTFDDGPNEQHTPVVLQELAQLGIRATFFISPAHFRIPSENKCNILRNMVTAGHDVQSHTFNHADIATLSNNELRNEITNLEVWMRDCLGDLANRITFNQLRPPFGSASSSAVSIANSMGYAVSTWNIDTRDYRQLGMDNTINEITRQYRNTRSSIL